MLTRFGRRIVRLTRKVRKRSDDHHAGEGGSALQVAALPYEVGADGTLRFLLITSRGSGKWIIPKGWPTRGRPFCVSAAREAREEAGVTGRVASRELGRVPYMKPVPRGHPAERVLAIYPLLVTTKLVTWPESHQRRRRWFSRAEATAIIGIPGLGEIIDAFDPLAAANGQCPETTAS